LAARRIVIAGLEKKNYSNHDGELKQRETHYALYWSDEQFDMAHVFPHHTE
jgi:hypothetical protein